MAEAIAFKIIDLKQNQGLGNALRVALDNCKFELVARMDSDDISQPFRFEKQLDYFRSNPSVDMVGGNITEFVGDENNITGQRYVPESDADIKRYMKKRCAFNHMSVMYKKTVVAKAGGYQDWFWNEDYYLWIRMMLRGAKFANVQDNIVNVRVGDEMSSRRGGMRYFKSEAGLQKYMLDNQIITYGQYFYNNAIRFAGEVLAPNWLRAKLFRFTRKKVDISAGKQIKRNMHPDTLADVEGFDQGNRVQRDETDKHLFNHSDYPPFSVAMSVYGKDNPEWFDSALESLLNQTVRPNEIVLVVDGPVPNSVQDVIDKYTEIFARGGYS